ncbi:TPA: hypothetical protein WI075_000375 [Neisseria meningitidis]|uniref:hypothetical protein n=1 Tax=Neisseria meningitidis TaxID=487 RepID=UPI0003015842|nr:hypothetical protein [Neisseria meningitidis]MCL5915544.1 hypothetical protein [Neisseria meningitidis]
MIDFHHPVPYIPNIHTVYPAGNKFRLKVTALFYSGLTKIRTRQRSRRQYK